MRKMEEEIFVANSKGDVKALGMKINCAAESKHHKPENPENLVPSQADPKKGTKTPINHANHRYLEGVGE